MRARPGRRRPLSTRRATDTSALLEGSREGRPRGDPSLLGGPSTALEPGSTLHAGRRPKIGLVRLGPMPTMFGFDQTRPSFGCTSAAFEQLSVGRSRAALPKCAPISATSGPDSTRRGPHSSNSWADPVGPGGGCHVGASDFTGTPLSSTPPLGVMLGAALKPAGGGFGGAVRASIKSGLGFRPQIDLRVWRGVIQNGPSDRRIRHECRVGASPLGSGQPELAS